MQKKRPITHISRKIFSLPAVILLAVFCVIVVQATFSLYKKNRQVALVLQNSRRDLATLHDRKVELQAQIDHLSTDKGLEIEARRKFDLGNPGERMLIVVDPSPNGASNTTQTQGIVSRFGHMLLRVIHLE